MTIEKMEMYSHFCKMAQISHSSYIEWRASIQDWLEDEELQKLYVEE